MRTRFSRLVPYAGALACAVLLPAAVLAHTTGVSFEKTVGAYRADIGYDPAAPQAGAPERFDFDLYAAGTQDEADFGDIWVRIMQGNDTLFATGIHRPAIGKATLLYTFPAGGTYTIDTRFEKDENAVTEVSFQLPVTAASGQGSAAGMPLLIGAALGGLILGALGALAYLRRK